MHVRIFTLWHAGARKEGKGREKGGKGRKTTTDVRNEREEPTYSGLKREKKIRQSRLVREQLVKSRYFFFMWTSRGDQKQPQTKHTRERQKHKARQQTQRTTLVHAHMHAWTRHSTRLTLSHHTIDTHHLQSRQCRHGATSRTTSPPTSPSRSHSLASPQ